MESSIDLKIKIIINDLYLLNSFPFDFSYIMARLATSFSDERSRSTRRTTDHGQATCKLYHLRLRV